MNNKEIEVKYKVNKIPDGFNNKLEFIQVYFDGKKKIDKLKKYFPSLDFKLINTYRVRMVDDNHKKSIILTLKSKEVDMVRDEYEIEISKDDMDELILNNELSKIIKNRYIYYLDDYKLELDEYLNLRISLLTLEIEFKSRYDLDENKKTLEKEIKEKFNLELTDVTNNGDYKNSNLIKTFGEKKYEI